MNRILSILGLGLALLAASPSALRAQVTAADSAAVLLDAARQFEGEGKREVAAALFGRIAARYPGTPAAAEAATWLAAFRRSYPEGSGRAELLVWSTLYGAWLGAAVPAALGADGPTPYGLGLLAGAPAGFLLARQAISGRPIGEGQARAITFGGTWGTWQGFGWRYVLGLGDKTTSVDCYQQTACYTYTETSTRAVIASLVLGGLGGISTGAWLASRGPIPAHHMTVVDLGALWGSWFGLAAGFGTGADGKPLMASTLIGGDIALVASALLAPRWNMSRGRARLISVAGVAGGVAGVGLDLLIQPDDEHLAILVPALTSALGLVAGAAWTRGYDEQRRGDGGPGDGNALLDVRAGRVGWGLPLPEPVLVPADRAGTRQEVGARLTLLRATF